MRKNKQYLFPGTIACYIVGSQTNPSQIIISLIWRGTILPEEAEHEEVLEAFRQALVDVLDWNSAQYNHGWSISLCASWCIKPCSKACS